MVIIGGLGLIALQWSHRGESYDEYEQQQQGESARIENLKKEIGEIEMTDNEAAMTEEQLLILNMHQQSFEQGGADLEEALKKRDNLKRYMEVQ